MAYNPSLYNPYGQPQPYSWRQPTWTAPQPSVTQPVNGLVSVTGIEGAKAYQLPPNSSMPLFDSNEDLLYVKTTDAGGFPTVKAFRFEAIDAPAVASEEQAYATKADLEALAARVEALSAPRTRTRKAAPDDE